MSEAAAPYLRIADSLRRRIESGQLADGERLPSMRALAKKHGVALATAAHALATLAAEGWVRSLPRVGYVVLARRAARKHEPSTELSRAAIVRVAISIADAEGFSALSLRGVAARMGAPVTSLYRHIASKEALCRAMADVVLGESTLPVVSPVGWRPRLELAARLHFQTLRRHPWLARLLSITRPRPLGNAIQYADWILGALDGFGLSAHQRMNLHILLHAFLQGLAVNLEIEAEAVGETGLSDDEWMQRELAEFDALAASGRYPAFAKTMRGLSHGFELDVDTLFETGLRALLDGFQLLLEPPPKAPGAKKVSKR